MAYSNGDAYIPLYSYLIWSKMLVKIVQIKAKIVMGFCQKIMLKVLFVTQVDLVNITKRLLMILVWEMKTTILLLKANAITPLLNKLILIAATCKLTNK